MGTNRIEDETVTSDYSYVNADISVSAKDINNNIIGNLTIKLNGTSTNPNQKFSLDKYISIEIKKPYCNK